ncbi:MAG: transcription elongation factor GreA [Planctomycetota bacterium]
MPNAQPMTREAYERLREEVQHMESVVMPDITEKLAAAREEGDLKENAEYHAQREAQGMLQAKIYQKKDLLARATIVDLDRLPKDEVGFGCTVTVEDLEFEDEEVYEMVGAGDEDFGKGKILTTSPLGEALMGKKIGDTAEFESPAGMVKMKVLDIQFPNS